MTENVIKMLIKNENVLENNLKLKMLFLNSFLKNKPTVFLLMDYYGIKKLKI